MLIYSSNYIILKKNVAYEDEVLSAHTKETIHYLKLASNNIFSEKPEYYLIRTIDVPNQKPGDTFFIVALQRPFNFLADAWGNTRKVNEAGAAPQHKSAGIELYFVIFKDGKADVFPTSFRRAQRKSI